MNKLYTGLLASLICASASVSGQERAQLSAVTRQYLHEAAKTEHESKPVPGFVYKALDGTVYISAFVKVADGFDEASLNATGAHAGTKAGNIWTVLVPIDRFAEFTRVPGIRNIDVDMPVTPLLDAARKTTKADSAQMGIGIPTPMSGKDVIVGIIDAGFDLNHPTFYDTLHQQYRISRIWLQKRAGTPPPGFVYGSEITDTNAIRAALCDTTIMTHGTHVAGIAGGSGYGSTGNRLYRGMAYQSELVFVGIMPQPYQWSMAGGADMVDGMNYIFNYAVATGKPCVVNLSWGGSIGPHDGTSLFSQACDVMTGPGRIFACSAGNSGQDTIHLGKTFTTSDSAISTFITFSPYLDSDNQRTWLDMWGDTGHSFCVNVQLYHDSIAVDSTGTICIADTLRDFKLVGSDGDTLFVSLSMAPTEYNGKPHILATFYSKTHDNICLTTTATSGQVNMWEGYVQPPSGYYGKLKQLGYPWAVNGDVQMTVSDFSGTHSAISVGAYTSKPSFTNISGSHLGYPGALLGRIAPFSSLGPTPDGQTRPDIAGPGFGLVSSVSSYDTSYMPGGDNYLGVISDVTMDGRTYPYAIAAGTSMSSPATAGIIALMLQMAPTLSPDSVKAIMAHTAITDAYTGTLPAGGNNTWGHGKVNAYGAVKYLASLTTVSNTLTKDVLDCFIYPNPTAGGTGTLYYKGAKEETLHVSVCDVTGKVIFEKVWMVKKGSNYLILPFDSVAKGLYFTKVSSKKGSATLKTIAQ